MPVRRCYVHIGIHKTGTTSIQYFLADNAAALAEGGLYYPHAGRLGAALPGHHNIAFEMSGRVPVVEGFGLRSDLLRELAGTAVPNACLSSEAFSTLYNRRQPLEALRDDLIALGFVPHIVLYVRAQDQFLESLYRQALVLDWILPFGEFVERALHDGFVGDENRIWLLDYDDLIVKPFREIFGAENMTVLGYPRAGSPDAIIRSFLGAVGIMETALHAGCDRYVLNVRWTAGELITRLFAYSQRLAPRVDFAHHAARLIAENAEAASLRYSLLGTSERERIAERFCAGNARMIEDWHVPPDTFAGDADTHDARRSRALFYEAEILRSSLLYAERT